MSNRYYSIRVDTAANAVADIQAALLAYYGAYDADTNPTGVAVLYSTSPYLIFTCTALADKPIRLYWSSGPCFYYGTGYTSGNNVDSPTAFSGTSSLGTVSAAHLVLGPHTLLLNVLQTTQNSRLVLLGQLKNGDYAVLGLNGSATTSYNNNNYGFNTTDGTALWPVGLDNGVQSASGHLYTQKLVLSNGVTGLELNGDGSVASFQDVLVAGYVTSATTLVVGATFMLTTCKMYMAGARQSLGTSLVMTFA